MSLSSLYTATLAACVAVPQHSVFATEQAEIQVKAFYGVNKTFWRAWDVGTMEWYAPSPPARCWVRFYETTGSIIGLEPLIETGGYLATCATPGTFKGTSQWMWMAILDYKPFAGSPYPITAVHVQYKNTNAGSIGMVRYPLTP